VPTARSILKLDQPTETEDTTRLRELATELSSIPVKIFMGHCSYHTPRSFESRGDGPDPKRPVTRVNTATLKGIIACVECLVIEKNSIQREATRKKRA
jgi:hypothetical protein